ncbi:hypothetical protein GCM10009110_18440 [Psychrobacter piscatorii]
MYVVNNVLSFELKKIVTHIKKGHSGLFKSRYCIKLSFFGLLFAYALLKISVTTFYNSNK